MTTVTNAHPKRAAIQEEIENIGIDSIVLLDGFDDAILGMINPTSDNPAVAYSVRLIVEELIEQGMDHEEAYEYFDFNISSAHMGPNTPVYVNDVPVVGENELDGLLDQVEDVLAGLKDTEKAKLAEDTAKQIHGGLAMSDEEAEVRASAFKIMMDGLANKHEPLLHYMLEKKGNSFAFNADELYEIVNRRILLITYDPAVNRVTMSSISLKDKSYA